MTGSYLDWLLFAVKRHAHRGGGILVSMLLCQAFLPFSPFPLPLFPLSPPPPPPEKPDTQAIPFWSVERVRSQCSETGARRNKREETFPFPFFTPLPKLPSARLLQPVFALGYFARPLDYPERDCLQSKTRAIATSTLHIIMLDCT